MASTRIWARENDVIEVKAYTDDPDVSDHFVMVEIDDVVSICLTVNQAQQIASAVLHKIGLPHNLNV
jgi:hypothetical protein